MQLVDLQISCGSTQAIKQEKVCTWTVKIDSHKSCHLKLPCNSYIFKIYQKHLFLCGKTEKFKIAVLAFFKQENLQ